MRMLIILGLVAAAFAANLPADPEGERIYGGSITDISKWPEMALLLLAFGSGGTTQSCGGSILNQRSILSAAHCFDFYVPSNFRVRLGSTYVSSGGVVYDAQDIFNHPSYGTPTLFDNDIAVLRIDGFITYTNNIQPGSIAGPNYNLADNQVVWATGWGITETGFVSEELREVQVWYVNQDICRTRYATGGVVISDNMLCSGWLDVGGRDQCAYDSGSPLFHNKVIVGVCSFGMGCASPFFPGVNVRVSRYTSWIQSHA